MTNTKKPKLSEIRARCPTTADYIYLINLVERLGKALECHMPHGHSSNCEPCKEARALLLEIKE